MRMTNLMGTRLLTIVLTLIICYRERLDGHFVITTVTWTKGCTGDKISSNKREWDVTVLLIIFVLCVGPEFLIVTLSGDELFFK